MKRIKEILRIIDFIQIIDFILFPFIYFVSIFFKPFLKNIWLIEENPNEACDNGYIFFKYISENKKNTNAYYVINKKSKDYQKVNKLGNVIFHKSIKHWIYYLNADKIIVTQKYANPSPALFHILHKYSILKNNRIFLQHGIIKDNAKMFYYDRTKFRIFICGAKKEYEYVTKTFKYPKNYVSYTGLARFDNLNLDNKNNKYILIYPTWRNYINNQKEFDKFISNYYKIIDNKNLINYLENNNLILQLVLHKNMKKFKINYTPMTNNIKINHNEEINIGDILNQTNLLITDFSSIYFDIAYRQKPIIYYQFDTKKYRENQLSEAYFSYKKDGFGDVYNESDLVINKILYYINNDFQIEEKYLKRMNLFFERRDKNNCKRIYEVISKL